VKFDPGGTIRWNNSYGDLYIEGWDRPEVEIAIIESTSYFAVPLKPDIGKKLEKVQVKIESRSDTELDLSTTPTHRHNVPLLPGNTRNGVTMEYRIHVPRNSRLVIQHGGGSVMAGNITGEIDIDNRDGDIMLMLPEKSAYSIDARSRMGHIASDFAGATHSRFLVGQRFIAEPGSPAHRIRLRTGFGGITVQALPPEGEALSTAAGDYEQSK
jgi:hypothetical protein